EGSIPGALYDQLLAEPGRCVTQAYLVEGHNRVRVYQPEGRPPPGFVPVPATLEDAYLVLIKTGGLPGTTSRQAGSAATGVLSTDGFLDDAAAAERGAR